MFTEEQKKEIKDFLEVTPGSIYIGCDSVRKRVVEKNKAGTSEIVWYAKFAVVLVVHIEDSKGGKIFHYVETERDYSQDKKPRMRLMNEVYKAVACFLEFEDIFAEQGRNVEIHLDVNPAHEHASSTVVKEACGYVKGRTNIDALIKPLAFGASYSADHVARNKPM